MFNSARQIFQSAPSKRISFFSYQHFAPVVQETAKVQTEERISRENYTISRLTEGITPSNRSGLSRMIDTFVSADPVVTAFKINKGREISQVLRDFLLHPIDQGLSFVATDNRTNEIIGLIINHVNDSDSGVSELAARLEDEREKELVRFWQLVGNEPKKLLKKQVYNIEYNIVDERYRKSGIALALGKMALRLAHELGFPLVRSECSNAYTSIIAEQMEYTREFSFAYEDILDSKANRVFTNIKPPHTHLHIYILHMDNAKLKPYLDNQPTTPQ